MDYFSLLPLELKEYIFQFLPGEDLWTCLGVCSEWRRIANFGKQWKNICLYEYIDTESCSDDDLEDSQMLCKYALLWKENAQTIRKWRTNSYKEHSIPYKNSEDLTCRRIYTHKKKIALITSKTPFGNSSDNIQIHTVGKTSHSIDEIPLSLRAHAVTINSDYVIISSGNVLITYKKDQEYKLYFGIAFCDDSLLHMATEMIPEFAALKLKTGPYVRMEVLSSEYLWLSCLNFTSQLVYIVHLPTLQLFAINIISRLVCTTKKYVVVATNEDIQVFNFKGDFVLKLNVQGRFKATDDFIVTSPKQGQPVTVWSMDGHRLHIIQGPVFFELDPVRHLLYECTQNGEENCKMTAICLQTGTHAWFVEMQKIRLAEIDDMYQVCDKFLIIDLYREQPNFHCAYVYDLNNKMLLYKAVLSGYTMRVSKNLWVLKTEDELIVQIY